MIRGIEGRSIFRFESGVWDFAGGDSEADRDLHLGNRQTHSENGKGKIAGVGFQLRPISHKLSSTGVSLGQEM